MNFADLVNKIVRHEPFSFSRYGDGEWSCILGATGSNCDGHKYFADLGEALRRCLRDRPEYVLGMQNFAQRRIGGRIQAFLRDNGLADLEWTDADLIHKANMQRKSGKLWRALDDRDVIIVGPSYLRTQPTVGYERFVEIPQKNCWTAWEEGGNVKARLFGLLASTRDMVVLFCASMAANVWVHECHKTFSQRGHTFIDLGSALDPWAGRQTRTYHRKLVVPANGVRKPKDIQGWFNFEWVYDELVERAKDGAQFVEVGAWKGRSAAHMAQAIRKSGKDITFYCVDTFEGSSTERQHQKMITELHRPLYKTFLTNMQVLGLRGFVNPIRATSVDAAECFGDQELEFVYIDSDHRYECIRADIDAWLPKVRASGFIGGHDIEKAPGVQRAVAECFGKRPRIHKNSWLMRVTDSDTR